MNSKEFKEVFSEVAQKNGFEKAFGGWFKESSECITVLDLQKSNYGDLYEMNFKVYIQGTFGNAYKKSKYLVKNDIGNYFTRQPSRFGPVFNFDNNMDDLTRKANLETLFADFIVPLTDRTLTKAGIIQMEKNAEIVILAAVKRELSRLMEG